MKSFFKYLCTPLFPARIGRIQFLNAIIANIILAVTAFVLLCIYITYVEKNVKILTLPLTSIKITEFIILIATLLWILVIVNKIVVTVKRLHDTNRSGWWILMFLVPIVNILFYILVFFCSGSIQENKFGLPPPKPTFINYFMIIISFSVIIILFIISTLVVKII